ncbi:MAG: ribose-5-phosphate isomerase RpiA [Alphaproteobacteria bacterium]
MARDRDAEKRRAAERSLMFVREGMRLGLGSGTTAALAVQLLGERVRQGLRVEGVSTSKQTRELAKAGGIPLITLDEASHLDLTIDGADEVDGAFRMIKGGGGALLREKVVASVSERIVIVVDSSKLVRVLGASPLPVEVAPFAWKVVAEHLRALGGSPELRRGSGGEAFVTEEGHYLVDCAFGRIGEPERLARALEALPGVVEHGLFLDLADVVVVGRSDGVEVMERQARPRRRAGAFGRAGK